MDVKKEAERIMENLDALLYYDPEELWKDIGRDEGIDIGRNEGIDIGKKETASNLIKEGIDLGIISKATNLEMQELKKMAMTMKA